MLERRGEEIEQYWSDLFKRAYLPQARAFPCANLFERIRIGGQTIALASSGKKDDVERDRGSRALPS